MPDLDAAIRARLGQYDAIIPRSEPMWGCPHGIGREV